MQNFWQILLFGIRRQLGLAVASVLLAVVVVACWAWSRGGFPPPDWWTWADMAATIFTLVVAVMVWLAEATQDWENSLPKRLNVVYLQMGKPVMICEDATLIGEGDIRAMAQQMGSQICAGEPLEFSPHFELIPARNERIREHGRSLVVRRYEIHIELTKLPRRLEQERQKSPYAVLVRRQKGDGGWGDEIEARE